jgi:hypothetical protein
MKIYFGGVVFWLCCSTTYSILFIDYSSFENCTDLVFVMAKPMVNSQSKSSEDDSDIQIAKNYLLNHVVDIDASSLNQFGLVQSRLAVSQIPEETCSRYREEFAKESVSANIALCSQLKKDAVAVKQELLLQHVRLHTSLLWQNFTLF